MAFSRSGRDRRRAFAPFIRDPQDEVARLDPEDPQDEVARLDPEDPQDEVARLDPEDPSGGGSGRRRRRRPARTRECYSGFIIIRLTDKVALRSPDFPELCKVPLKEENGSAGEPPEDHELELPRDRIPGGPQETETAWPEMPAGHGKKDGGLVWLTWLLEECPPTRLVQVVHPAAIRRIEQLALATALAPFHSLAAYWRLDARHLPAGIVRGIVRLLNEFAEIDLAYRELAAFDPQDTPSFGDQQQYLERAPLGVNLRRALAKADEAEDAGTGVTVVDLEQGWFAHEDLNPTGVAALRLLYGDNRDEVDDYRGDHGTAVLGQLAARRDDKGVVGIVPGAGVELVSHYRERFEGVATPSNGHVADGVMAAVLQVRFQLVPGSLRGLTPAEQESRIAAQAGARAAGDVLLMEVQRGFKPAEVDHADFDALRLASALGVIVIEAAGNGRFDLDDYRDETGRRILARGARGFRDSGAIVVGACESALPHDRAAFSNHGSRLDCFSHGDNVVTCGFGDLFDGGRDKTYTRRFSGTSSAAPIVAGAAAFVQWLHEKRSGSRLGPGEMRRVLANPSTGILQGPGVLGRIGVMPDLEAVIDGLDLVPALYAPVVQGAANEAALFAFPSPRIEARDDELFLELRNYGSGSPEVEVVLYGSELAPLPTPEMWRRLQINPSPSAIVPAGGRPVRFGPLRPPDPPSRFLPAGNSAFLALLRYPGEPAPVLPPGPPYFDRTAFLDFSCRYRGDLVLIREVDDEVELPFLITGLSGSPEVFQFEIARLLPAAARVSLELPSFLAASVKKHRQWSFEDRDAGATRFLLPAQPRVFLPPLRLAGAGSFRRREEARVGRYPARLVVTGAAPDHTVILRQILPHGPVDEVGRITWKFVKES